MPAASAGEVSPLAPAPASVETPTNAPQTLDTGVREALEAAARKSWQWGALEALESLRGKIVQDAGAGVLAPYRALRDAIRVDVTGISPDALPYPEDNPPVSWRQGAQTFPNTWEGRPGWKAEALKAAQVVIDAIDVDASTGVFNEWGLFKEALQKAKPPAAE